MRDLFTVFTLFTHILNTAGLCYHPRPSLRNQHKSGPSSKRVNNGER